MTAAFGNVRLNLDTDVVSNFTAHDGAHGSRGRELLCPLRPIVSIAKKDRPSSPNVILVRGLNSDRPNFMGKRLEE